MLTASCRVSQSKPPLARASWRRFSGLASSDRCPTAINDQRVARHVRRSVGREEEQRSGELFWAPRTPQGCPQSEPTKKRVGDIHGVGSSFFRIRERSGQDCIGTDSLCPPEGRHVASKC